MLVELECEDATTQLWLAFFDAGRGRMSDRRIAFDSNDGATALTFSGRFGSHRAVGTLSFTVAGLTDQVEAQLCTSGEVEWRQRMTKSRRIGRIQVRNRQLDGIARMTVHKGSTEVRIRRPAA